MHRCGLGWVAVRHGSGVRTKEDLGWCVWVVILFAVCGMHAGFVAALSAIGATGLVCIGSSCILAVAGSIPVGGGGARCGAVGAVRVLFFFSCTRLFSCAAIRFFVSPCFPELRREGFSFHSDQSAPGSHSSWVVTPRSPFNPLGWGGGEPETAARVVTPG